MVYVHEQYLACWDLMWETVVGICMATSACISPAVVLPLH